MLVKVECGFKKWSIGYDKGTTAVTIEFFHYPNKGKISLYDATKEELTALGQMFTALGNTDIKEII